jgi:glycosyltransferase involved in cell wall biosynthesis
MDPLVSILIPAYNAEAWVADTIKSALAQTWPRKEIILVDDGSADATVAIAKRYEAPNVKVITQRNQGAAAARNTAFALSRGEYIQWLDADDLMAPEKIAAQVSALSAYRGQRYLASGPWAHFLHRSHRAQFTPNDLWRDLPPVEWMLCKMAQNLHMQTATWLVDRATTEAAGPWDTRLLVDDDGEYFSRVLLNSAGVKFVPEARVFYRASGSTSLSYIGRSSKKIEAHFLSMRLHIDYIRSLEDSARVRAACVTYLQNWLPDFYPERPDIVDKAMALAEELGGRLEAPRLSWKYEWLSALGGPTLAKRAQVTARNARWLVARSLDKCLLLLEQVRASSDASRIHGASHRSAAD